MLPDTRRAVYAHLFKLPSDRDEAQLVAVGQFQVCELPSVAGCRRFELCDFVIVWQGQEPPNVGIDETFAHHFRNLAFRAQDFRDAQAAQDAFLVGVVRPNDHPRQLQVEQVQRGQHGRFEVLANGHDSGIEVLNVLGEQRFFVRGVQRHRQAHVLFEQLRPVGVGIKGEHLRTATGEGQGDLGAITACAKHCKTGLCHVTKDERNADKSVKRPPRVPSGQLPKRG